MARKSKPVNLLVLRAEGFWYFIQPMYDIYVLHAVCIHTLSVQQYTHAHAGACWPMIQTNGPIWGMTQQKKWGHIYIPHIHRYRLQGYKQSESNVKMTESADGDYTATGSRPLLYVELLPNVCTPYFLLFVTEDPPHTYHTTYHMVYIWHRSST